MFIREALYTRKQSVFCKHFLHVRVRVCRNNPAAVDYRVQTEDAETLRERVDWILYLENYQQLYARESCNYWLFVFKRGTLTLHTMQLQLLV